jgi:hypothetical protein
MGAASQHSAGFDAAVGSRWPVGCPGALVGSAGLTPQKAPKPPSQPVTPAGLLPLLAVLEPANSARFSVAVEKPPPVRVRRTGRFRSVGAAVGHDLLTGLSRRVANVAATARLAAWSFGRAPHGGRPAGHWRRTPQPRPTSPRRIPSRPAKDRHHSVWRDEPATARENPAGRPPGGR